MRVEFARSEGLPLDVRGGGHSIPGFSTTDGGVVLDLSRMTGIRVDPVSRRVVAQAGCLWSDVDHETQVRTPKASYAWFREMLAEQRHQD